MHFDCRGERLILGLRHASGNASCRVPQATCRGYQSGSSRRIAGLTTSDPCYGGDCRASFLSSLSVSLQHHHCCLILLAALLQANRSSVSVWPAPAFGPRCPTTSHGLGQRHPQRQPASAVESISVHNSRDAGQALRLHCKTFLRACSCSLCAVRLREVFGVYWPWILRCLISRLINQIGGQSYRSCSINTRPSETIFALNLLVTGGGAKRGDSQSVNFALNRLSR